MQHDLIREAEISERNPRRPWGEMAVVADPDEFDDLDDGTPPTLRDPHPPSER